MYKGGTLGEPEKVSTRYSTPSHDTANAQS